MNDQSHDLQQDLRAFCEREYAGRISDDELEQIAAEARYHRDRLALYRARMHSAVEGTSLTRLRELERIATAARERLRHARRARSSSNAGE